MNDHENADALEQFVAHALGDENWQGNDDDVFELVKRAVEHFTVSVQDAPDLTPTRTIQMQGDDGEWHDIEVDLSTRHHTDCDHYQSWLTSAVPIGYVMEIAPCNLSCATEDDGSDDYHATED